VLAAGWGFTGMGLIGPTGFFRLIRPYRQRDIEPSDYWVFLPIGLLILAGWWAVYWWRAERAKRSRGDGHP
jgi:hypothetical protein